MIKKIVKVRKNTHNSGTYVSIPTVFQDSIFSDYYTCSCQEDGSFLYSPVNMSDAAADVQSQTAPHTNHKRKALIC